MTFQERYSNLNAAQKTAVDTIDGPVMVVAGPGTGKTELLSMRVANILQKTDTLPENILCLTFTESGQAAMRERLVSIIGKDAYKVSIHTFHSFGGDIIAKNREYFYKNAQFSPADELKQYEILRAIFESLPHDNPLASMMNGEYTQQNSAKAIISELKRRSALNSDELQEVLAQNEATIAVAEALLVPIFEARISAATAPKLHEALAALQAHAATVEPLYNITPLAQVIATSLAGALDDAATIHPTKPLTAWKNKWFEKNDAKQLVTKDRKRLAKLGALVEIYREYLTRMEQQNLFDFDDMIMQVVHAMETYDDLRFNLQEKYLYIMVDEFQDTNPAQLRILTNLTNNPVNEGMPNILVVGDDDQAIYGFQGADISNILNFSDQYPARKLIVLTQNYRSGAPVLEASRAVITQAGDRLETRIAELDKNLQAQPTAVATTELWQAPTIEAERLAICESISAAIKNGIAPQSIAVIARRHADISALLPYLQHAGIPVRYEREESVLDSPVIRALEQLGTVILALAEARHDDAQSLLPELLAHPAWGITPHELWRLSLDSYTNRQNWMEVMATTPRFVAIHTWLTELAQSAVTSPLEPLIDRMIGREGEPQNEGDDTPAMTSPFFTYFFGEDALTTEPQRYLECLSALRAIRSRLREYQAASSSDTTLTLKDFIHFIALHRRLGVPLMTREFSLASDVPAVQLLTAHKSKGLEFDTVYVLHSADTIWGRSARTISRSIAYPENLPLQSGGNTADERLRLYYVAMTRARKQLILTHSDVDDSGKHTLIADFLVDSPMTIKEVADGTIETEITAAELAWYEPLVQPTTDLKTLLAPQLEKFKLSATSLNAFLDVSRGGPREFLLKNLLHFPQTKSPSASYGTAVHAALQRAHTHVVATNEQKPVAEILKDFEIELTKERLSKQDFIFYRDKGREQLPLFLNSGKLPMTTSQKAEVSFGGQAVVLENARLTGALDVVDINKEDRTICVTDYKTGKPAIAWDRGSDYTKLKLHKYRQQLLFYKLLIENSADYSTYTTARGHLAFIEPTNSGESVVLPLDLTAEEVERTRQLIEKVWHRIITLDLPDTSQYSPDLKGVLAFEQDLLDENV